MYFITSSENKVREIQAVYPGIKQLKLELDEIQSLDPQAIIEHKLKEALRHHKGPFIVEDTSLVVEAIDGLPGTFVKWFNPETVAKIAGLVGNRNAKALVMIGYTEEGQKPQYFQGEISGTIVLPQGEGGFGYDRIFVPEGETKTFAELPFDRKIALSPRTIAMKKLLSNLHVM